MKKVPLRRCIGCRRSFEKNELIRVVRTPENKIITDDTGKSNGRGAYICKNTECLAAAMKKNQLENALEIKISKAEKEELEKLISAKIAENNQETN